MALKSKELTVFYGIGLLTGQLEEYNNSSTQKDSKRKFWVSMGWTNPWYSGYYLGYDQETGHYVIEWRNLDMSSDMESETVISLHPLSYLEDDAKMLTKAVKKHKKTKE